jgi:hypothetical protein
MRNIRTGRTDSSSRNMTWLKPLGPRSGTNRSQRQSGKFATRATRYCGSGVCILHFHFLVVESLQMADESWEGDARRSK